MQARADNNGELYYELPEGSIHEGDHLNVYGACSHPSAHFEEGSGYYGRPTYLCDVCGEVIPSVIDLSREPDNPEPERLLGDADGDGQITSLDVTWLLRCAAQIEIPYTEEQLLSSCDIDGNGRIEVFDATCIQRYLASMDTEYPVGKPLSSTNCL